MRKTALVVNSIVVVYFLCFVAYTFFAREHLNGLARGFVTKKTLHYSKSIVDLAEESLHVRLVCKLLSGEQEAAIRKEIADYRLDPPAYIADLTRHKVRNLPLAKMNPMLAKVTLIKEKIRVFYDNTLESLVKDLRIFSVSNLVAGVIAFFLAYLSKPNIRKSVVLVSFAMCIAVLYGSYLYVDNLTFFRILFRAHLGWWYPVTLGLTIAAAYYDLRRNASSGKTESGALVDGARRLE